MGWLNRLVGQNDTTTPIEAIHFGGGVPITALAGPEPALVTTDVDSVSLSGYWDDASEAKRRAALAKLWDGVAGPLATGARNAFDVVEEFRPVRDGSATPANGAAYPAGSDLGSALAATARTIRADVGAEVIAMTGSWDHHTWIGSPDSGDLCQMADEFALSLAAFLTDLGPLATNVTVVTVSEFGRRVKENANQGLDHGYGNVMFLLGGGVKGGYYGTWPGWPTPWTPTCWSRPTTAACSARWSPSGSVPRRRRSSPASRLSRWARCCRPQPRFLARLSH